MSAGMANYVKDVQPERVLMMTECSMSENVSAENPNVDFVKPCNLCPHMKRITLDNILTSLETLQPRVEIDPDITARARVAVERMVAVG
jgi:quinolinate synthase